MDIKLIESGPSQSCFKGLRWFVLEKLLNNQISAELLLTVWFF